jgi:hypothetical protein
MPTTNLAHERFITAIKEGKDRIRAYQAAYPGASYNAARANVCRLLRNPYIQQMLSEHDVSLDEMVNKARLSATILRLDEYYERQAGFLDIIKGGLVEKRGHNGEISLKPATIDDKLRAARAAINYKDAFLARYPQHKSVQDNWENG